MRLRILPSALGDLDRGRTFYARNGEELGDYFLDSLFADIDALALYAGIHIQIWGFHRMLARRFPYAIYYKVDGDVCTVWRVLDCRRRPSQTRKALEGTS
jgi:plasmid stabilization system protein ParE